MSAVDKYLKNVEPSRRKELQRIRAFARAIVPAAEETISYSMPTLKLRGKPFLGFCAHANHIGIYPYSGRVLEKLDAHLGAHSRTKSALHVPIDRPISKALLKRIITARLDELKPVKKAK